MARRKRNETKYFRTSTEEKLKLNEYLIKHNYNRSTPLIEIIFDLFDKVESLEAEKFTNKMEMKTITEIETENKIINTKLNLNIEILKYVFDLSDEKIEEIKKQLIRKNMNK